MLNLDKIGITTSVLCAIHCTLLPILIVAVPIFSISLFATELFEWVILSLSLILCLFSLCFGFQKHKSFKAFSYAGIGFSLLIIARMLHHHFESNHEFKFDLFNLILLAGGFFVTLSHVINSKLCKKCSVCIKDGCCNG
jgi:hypothetical protein